MASRIPVVFSGNWDNIIGHADVDDNRIVITLTKEAFVKEIEEATHLNLDRLLSLDATFVAKPAVQAK